VSRPILEEGIPMVCKLVKKGVLGAAIGAGALALLFGTSARYYAHTAYHQVRDSARKNVPVQYDIDKARQQVAELEPAIHNNIEQIARAEVEIEYLEREIATTQSNLESQGKKLVALREHAGDSHVKLTGGVSYSADEIKGEMARQLDHYRTVKAILADKEETLNLRKKSLIAFRDQNAQMRDAKRALVTQIEAIETRLRQIEATQAANEFTFDDSALARARKTVAELSKRVEVIQRVSEHEGRYTDVHAPVLVDPTRDIVSEVDAEFGHASQPEASDHSL
jgi:chromosome segregation ATPase